MQLFLRSIKSIFLSALFILIGISILVAAVFLIAFLWSVNDGQYDDDYTPSVRMLFDDELTSGNTESITEK
jgi:cbb3-type cytochrome oxidase maturation protein